MPSVDDSAACQFFTRHILYIFDCPLFVAVDAFFVCVVFIVFWRYKIEPVV